MSFTSVSVGHAKIIIDPVTGSVSEPYLGPTWFFRLPWTQTVDIYYAMTSTEMWTDNEAMTQGEFPAIHVLSKDGLDIEVDILIRYQLDPIGLKSLYRNFPDLKYEARAISSIVREDVRDVVSQFLALEIIEQREQISATMRETIYESLVTETSLHQALLEQSIEIDLRDIDPPLNFKAAIEAKLTAEQQKIQAEFEKSRILILANATAQQAIRLAEGEARARMIVANATRDAVNQIISITGDQENASQMAQLYLTLEALKNIAKDTGQMVVFWMMGEDNVPIMYPINP